MKTESTEFQKGYEAAVDDVQAAMKSAEVHSIGPMGILSQNDPTRFVAALKELYRNRFPFG